MTGAGTVQPRSERQDVLDRQRRYRAALRPRDPVEEDIADTIALAMTRLKRSGRQELAALDALHDTVTADFRAGRYRALAPLAAKLDADPPTVLAELQSTAPAATA
jgi:hypothetical protein